MNKNTIFRRIAALQPSLIYWARNPHVQLRTFQFLRAVRLALQPKDLIFEEFIGLSDA